MMLCLDTNIFIQAHQHICPMDVMPGYWEALVLFAREQRICSIDWVYREIAENEDELSDWAREHKFMFKSSEDDATQKKLKEIANWIEQNKQYTDEAKENFLNGADPWLIAYALTHKCKIVTLERPEPMSKKKIKIPDICRVNALQCVNLMAMLRQLKVRLVLEQSFDVIAPRPGETALLAEAALAEDWNRPEEETAWSHLQPEK